MPHCGLRVSAVWACVNTVSPGRRLTRPAPFLIAPSWTDEIPLRLLRMLPASLVVSASLNLRGGAKSSPVNVLDFLRRWGLGREAISSKEETNGEWMC